MLKSVLAITVPLALLGAPLSGLDAEDEDSARSDAYDAMLGCAAFHTIESTSSSGDAAAAQKAVAYDFAGVAARLAPDGRTETANADLEKRLTDYRAKLDTGMDRIGQRLPRIIPGEGRGGEGFGSRTSG